MSQKQLSRWCLSVLPAHYHAIRELTEQYQQFLAQQLPEQIAESTRVINIDLSKIVIAVDSAQVANYLRLHLREITQQFEETFGGNRKVIVKTMPASLLQVESRPVTARPRKVSGEVIENLESNARCIEDENLRKALRSLANRLKKS